MSKTFNHPSIINNNHGNITADCSLSALKQLKKQKREREKNIEYTKMAMRMWASSTANALKISVASKTSLSLPRCFSSVVDGLKYATSHEWVKHDGPVATIGITDHAQDHLGEVVFVELPEVGASFKKGEPFGAVESVKATSDVNSPVSGEVVEVNSALTEAPGAINKEPYTGGWLIKVKPSTPAELDALLGAKEYTKFCEEEDAAH